MIAVNWLINIFSGKRVLYNYTRPEKTDLLGKPTHIIDWGSLINHKYCFSHCDLDVPLSPTKEIRLL